MIQSDSESCPFNRTGNINDRFTRPGHDGREGVAFTTFPQFYGLTKAACRLGLCLERDGSTAHQTTNDDMITTINQLYRSNIP